MSVLFCCRSTGLLATSCRLVWNFTDGKNNNIVGQGLAPAVSFGVISLKKRANAVRPYGWIFYHLFEIRTPTNPPPFEKGGPKLYYLAQNLTRDKKERCRFILHLSSLFMHQRFFSASMISRGYSPASTRAFIAALDAGRSSP